MNEDHVANLHECPHCEYEEKTKSLLKSTLVTIMWLYECPHCEKSRTQKLIITAYEERSWYRTYINVLIVGMKPTRNQIKQHMSGNLKLIISL